MRAPQAPGAKSPDRTGAAVPPGARVDRLDMAAAAAVAPAVQAFDLISRGAIGPISISRNVNGKTVLVTNYTAAESTRIGNDSICIPRYSRSTHLVAKNAQRTGLAQILPSKHWRCSMIQPMSKRRVSSHITQCFKKA